MNATAQLLAAAQEHHRAKRFHEAEVVYRSILNDEPNNAEAWRLLGLIAHEAKQHAAALEMIQRALQLQPNHAAAHHSLGVVFEARGDHQQAADCFRHAVRLAPEQAEHHDSLGQCLHALGRHQEAAECFRTALRLRPDFAAAHRHLGRTLHRLGRLQEAVDSFQEAIHLEPDFAEAHHHLSQTYRDLGRADDEIASLRAAVRLRNQEPEACNDLGLSLARSGKYEEAAKAFGDAIRQRPGFAAAYNNLGNSLKLLGRHADAELAFLRAIRSDPTDVVYHLNLGFLHEERGEPAEAIISFQTAVRLQPERADGHRAMARALEKLDRQRESLDAYRRAVELNPKDTLALNEMGNLLQEMERHEEAKATYRQALAVQPNFGPAHSNLGYILADEGLCEDARRHYGEALRLQPTQHLRLVSDTMLPPIYESHEHMKEVRQRLSDNLLRLDVEGVRVDPTREVVPTLFYLAYMGQNDRNIQASLTRLAQGPRAVAVKPAARSGGGKIHVGFVSRNFKNHTIGRLMAGVIAGLDRKKFLVTVLSVGRFDDEGGRRIRQSADRYVVVPSQPAAALQTIAAQGVDILYYADIGMDPFTFTLAFSRCAPVQCVTWGHPLTTGIPVMDYFISSADLDTPDGQAHYTEKLARLNTLTVFYDRVTAPAPLKDRGFFGLPEKAHVYACPQTLFKFHPDYDDVLSRILRQDPKGIVVLIEGKYPKWKDLLLARFRRSFGDVLDRVHFVHRQSRDNYLNLLAVADVLLDPLHFGGGNSSYEGLGLGVPIVTLPSAFLRGRITYAQYRKMGLMDCVVHNNDDYVRLALALGTNRQRREEVSKKILAANSVLFEDPEALRELERFFQQVVKA